MRYLKLYENFFGSGIKELIGYEWVIRNDLVRKFGNDIFTKRELDFFRNFFVKGDQYDFFRRSGEKLSGIGKDGSILSRERRSAFKVRYMPANNQKDPIEISIGRLGDDYYFVSIKCMSQGESKFSTYKSSSDIPNPKMYLIDTFEDLKDFLFNIEHVWRIINTKYNYSK